MNGVGTLHLRNAPVCEGFLSDYRQSGYDQLVSLFSDYSAPLFFSEYGCNLVQPREFTEVGAICILPLPQIRRH